MLILDEPFIGLDADGRDGGGRLLGELAGEGARLVLITRAGHLPEWVTHVWS